MRRFALRLLLDDPLWCIPLIIVCKIWMQFRNTRINLPVQAPFSMAVHSPGAVAQGARS
ncbi:hypothetical protein EMIT0P74_120124 [Pseudomonas sp. IT-P74]